MGDGGFWPSGFGVIALDGSTTEGSHQVVNPQPPELLFGCCPPRPSIRKKAPQPISAPLSPSQLLSTSCSHSRPPVSPGGGRGPVPSPSPPSRGRPPRLSGREGRTWSEGVFGAPRSGCGFREPVGVTFGVKETVLGHGRGGKTKQKSHKKIRFVLRGGGRFVRVTTSQGPKGNEHLSCPNISCPPYKVSSLLTLMISDVCSGSRTSPPKPTIIGTVETPSR